jgi:hypothetical protein
MNTTHYYTEKITKQKTVFDIYGKDLSEIQTPLGYIQESFEPPKLGVHKYFLNIHGQVVPVEGAFMSTYKDENPRIILKKQPYYRMKTGVQPRIPNRGDWIVATATDGDQFMHLVPINYSDEKYFTFEKVEE